MNINLNTNKCMWGSLSFFNRLATSIGVLGLFTVILKDGNLYPVCKIVFARRSAMALAEIRLKLPNLLFQSPLSNTFANQSIYVAT